MFHKYSDQGSDVKIRLVMYTMYDLQCENHVHTASEFHDLNMDFVVLRQLPVCLTIASKNYTYRMQEYRFETFKTSMSSNVKFYIPFLPPSPPAQA